MTSLAELAKNSGDAISPVAGLAVATSVEISRQLDADPFIAAAAAAELEDVFRNGATVGAHVVAHNCRIVSSTDHVYITG